MAKLDLNEITATCNELDDRLGSQEWTLEGPGLVGIERLEEDEK